MSFLLVKKEVLVMLSAGLNSVLHAIKLLSEEFHW